MRILGIETSCDETGIAIVENGTTIICQSLASSMDLHSLYGGVIPEIAARSHIESILPILDNVLVKYISDSKDPWDDIDGIAVTYGAGLSGSLLIGVLTARTLAIVKNKPLYNINHVEAHVYANFLSDNRPQFPMLALIVSGGHSQLVYFRDHFDYDLLGQTVDDAIGEAFDKVAKIIGVPYPGGPNISKIAKLGNAYKYDLPKAKLEAKYNFSFSGLKTAVLRLSQHETGGDYRTPSYELPHRLLEAQKADIAASFQRIAVETVVDKTVQAYEQYNPKTVVIAGGVAANLELRKQLSQRLPITINYALPELCTDNGAMVAALGCYKALSNISKADPYSLAIEPNLKM